ncbi:helix-turn-helix domain-containing protein [Stackebrandtia soli]|uniref:helix-turn-helix domain-containing protein n=1 Tax=Stackebrandtia soli TaxID=1892856 RepID=UPI0039ECDDA3
MLTAGPVVDPQWWTQESFRGVPLREHLRTRDFGPVFSFLKARGWSVAAIAAVTRVQEARIREIMAGRRKVTSYEVVERIATGLSIDRALCGIGMDLSRTCRCSDDPESDTMSELMRRADDLGPQSLAALMAHTDHIRDLVDSIGAQAALTALVAHLSTLTSLRAFSLQQSRRRQLANVYHDAACLAAGLYRAAGRDALAWRHHEAAKDAAREAECPAALAHTLRLQAAMLDQAGQPGRAVRLSGQAEELARGGRLADVSRGDEPTHYHGRLYQNVIAETGPTESSPPTVAV